MSFANCRLIGIAGKKGSGKSTLAEFLTMNRGFTEMAMADPLKGALRELFLFTDDQLYGSQEDKETPDPRWYGVSPRQCMQFFGTEVIRDQMKVLIPDIGDDFHVHRFELWFLGWKEKNPKGMVCVSDIRFQNEADMIRRLGGQIIHITRPDLESTDNHSSEVGELTGTMLEIVNDDTLSILYDKVRGLFSSP